MSGRYRTVALQAIGVVILAAVVYLAFLRDSGPGDLSRIDARGGDPPTASRGGGPDEGHDGKEDRDLGPDGKDRRPDRAGRDSRLPGAGGAGGLGEAFANPPVSGTGPPGPQGTPPDNQYESLATILMEEVGQPALFRAIDPGR
jgi:hypothetical protein